MFPPLLFVAEEIYREQYPAGSFLRLVAEYFLHLVEKSFCDRRCVLVAQAVKILEQFFLFCRKLARDLNDGPAELVAAPGPPKMRKSLAAKPEYVARLGTGGGLEFSAPRERLHFNLISQPRP